MSDRVEERALQARAVAIVPAAGRAVRFGGGKLIADLSGEPLLNHTLRCLLHGGIARVVVVLSAESLLESVSLLKDSRVTVVVNPDPSRGMFSSIQTGVAAAEGDPMIVLPADMPFVTSATVAAVVAECQRTDRLVVPVYQSRRGHPLAIPSRLRAMLLSADPLKSLRDALTTARELEVGEIDTHDAGVVQDVDVRADLTSHARNRIM